MHSRHLWASATLLAAALAAGALLVVEPAPWHRDTALVVAAFVQIWATVAVVAILLEHSRLGYRLALLVLLTCAAIALGHRITTAWWIAVVLQAIAALVFSDPALGGWVRRRTSAAPVPSQAVLLALILLLLPGLTALSTPRVHPGVLSALAGIDLTLLLIYVRRPAFSLALVRVLPIVLAGVGLMLPDPGRWIWIAGQLAALALAWTREVRLAVRPLIERGSRVMIPPELAPEEIRQMLEDRG